MADLALSFPFDLTQAAVWNNGWDKNFAHLTRSQILGALARLHLRRANALKFTCCVLLVSCCAAEYESSMFRDRDNGVIADSWVEDNGLKPWSEIAQAYYYGAWNKLVTENMYPHEHEPLVLTFEALNNEPRGTNIFDV